MGKHRNPNFQNYRKSQKSDNKGKNAQQESSSLPLCGGRYKVSWDEYHGVPTGWSKTEIVAAHQQLKGAFSVDGLVVVARGMRDLTNEENSWFGYKRCLYQIADGVKAGDRACVELAIRYIELRFIGSYSGFLRGLMARRLKHVELAEDQQKRLIRHFEWITAHDDYTQEFRDYEKLWKYIARS